MQVDLAERLRRQVTISRRTAEAERNATEVDAVTQRLHLKRAKQIIRLECVGGSIRMHATQQFPAKAVVQHSRLTFTSVSGPFNRRDSERAEMAQLGEQSSVVALQRTREIREASMPSDTLERGTLLPQERVGKLWDGLHGLGRH